MNSAVKIYSLAELRASTFAPPKPLVCGFLNQGETIILVGKPKIGKSRIVQQLAINASRGEHWLGMEIPRPLRILMCDLENRPSGARARFAAMSGAHDGDSRIHIFAPETLSENSIACATADGIGRLTTLVEKIDPDILIIDPFRLFLGGDGNKEQVVVDGLKVLSTLREAHPRMSIILIHHLRKQDSHNHITLRSDPSSWVEGAAGSYALVAHADATYGIEREMTEGGEELIVFGGIARTLSPPTLILEEDEETLLFRVGKGAATADKLFTPVERDIWKVASRLGTFTHGQLLDAARTTNKKAISKTLSKAESAGLLVHQGKQYTLLAERVLPIAA
jgi:hypothetical protein